MTTTKQAPSAPQPTPAEAEEEKRFSVLWAMYTQAGFPFEVVDFPVSNRFLVKEALDQLAMVAIDVESRMLCQSEADDYARQYVSKHPPKEGEVNKAFEAIYDMDTTIRVLWRACITVDGANAGKRIRVFPSPYAMRRALTADQISVLAHHYVRVERMLSPIEDLGTVDDLNAFVEKLRAAGRKFPLDYLSSEGMKELIWHLVFQPPRSPSDSSSPGSPPGESGPTTGSESPPEASADGDGPRDDAAPPDEPGEAAPPDPKPVIYHSKVE